MENTMEMENMEMENTESKKFTVTKRDGAMAAAGAGIAGATGATAWWLERNKRLKALKGLEQTMCDFAQVTEGNVVDVTERKKYIFFGPTVEEKRSLSSDIVNPIGLVVEIQKNLESAKLSKKERKRWDEVMSHLVMGSAFGYVPEEEEKVKETFETETKK